MKRLEQWQPAKGVRKSAERTCGNCRHGYRNRAGGVIRYEGCPNSDCGTGTLVWVKNKGWQHRDAA